MYLSNFKNRSSVSLVFITVCTVVLTVVTVVPKSIGNGTFGGAPSQKPFNGSTQNLAGMITSVTGVNTLNGISIGSGA